MADGATLNGRTPSKPKGQTPAKGQGRSIDYTSEGVKNNDVFRLPSSDWQMLAGLTVIALFVRLFRIYQPSSVVFDEVQYVFSKTWDP